MFWRKPKLTPEEHARALELVLRDLGPEDRQRAEALLGRLTSKLRDKTERLLVKSGTKAWPRIEQIMLRFGEFTPAPSDHADEGAHTAPQDQSAASAVLASEQREQANRALGR